MVLAINNAIQSNKLYDKGRFITTRIHAPKVPQQSARRLLTLPVHLDGVDALDSGTTRTSDRLREQVTLAKTA